MISVSSSSTSDLAARLDVARGMVEEVVLSLAELPPRVDRGPMVTLLDRAQALLGSSAAAPLEAAEHLEGVLAASASILGAATMLTASAPDLAPAREAARRLRRVQRELERYRKDAIDEIAARPIVPEPIAPAREPKPFVASAALPSLHHLDRGPLAPLVRVDPRFDAIDDQEDEGLPGERRPSREAPRYDLSAGRFIAELRGLARDCFEELGQLGGLREPHDDVPWTPDLVRFEERLLADLDAAVALADPVMFDGARTLALDVLRELMIWAADAFTVDPGRAFARAFILGSIAGEDRVRAAVLALRQSSPLTHEAEARALALAPSPDVTPAMEALALGDDARLSALALEVLRARREGDVAIAGALSAHPDVGVRRAVAGFLGTVRDREAALALLDTLIDVDPDPRVRALAAESLVRLGSRRGLDCARALLLAEEPADARSATISRQILAAAGDARDLEILLRALAAGAPEDIAAIGWHGHAAAIEPLLDAIEADPPRFGIDARLDALCAAVERITGEAIEPQADGVVAFRAFWRESQARFGPGSARPSRFRRGQPWSPLLSLEALAQPAPARDRELIALELAAVTRGAVRLRTGDWVARQLHEISAAREGLGADEARYPAGAWPADQLI